MRPALEDVRAAAERSRPRDLARIASVLVERFDADALLAAFGRGVPVTLCFHPDRLLADGRTVAEGLLSDGVYRNQFETGVSSGGLTAFPGGDRDEWERALFGGAYHVPGVAAGDRPRYGGLNVMGYLNGACPRFGSCVLVLRLEASSRCTFLFGDSAAGVVELGVLGELGPVLAPLLEAIANTRSALGRSDLSVGEFASGVLRGDAAAGEGLFAPAMTNTLNDYIEAHVHGPVSLAEDAAALVADPSFRGTPTGDVLREVADRYGIAFEWHPGLTLPLDDVPAEAPGEEMRWQRFCAGGRARRLAERIASDRLDAATIGCAAADFTHHPDRWADMPDAPTRFKDLWHLTVAHGT